MSQTVVFNVRVDTECNDVVGVVGNSSELGEWNHERAVLLERQTNNASGERYAQIIGIGIWMFLHSKSIPTKSLCCWMLSVLQTLQ